MSQLSKSTASDPRRPEDVQILDRSKINGDLRTPDTMLLAAFVLGMMALLLKVKIAAWASVLCAISAIAHMPYSNTEWKHVVSTLTFAVMGLLFSYLAPVRAPA
jgi:ribosomal protein L18E